MNNKDLTINLKVVPQSKRDLDLLNMYLVNKKYMYVDLSLFITQGDVDLYECKIKNQLKKIAIKWEKGLIDNN